MKKVIETKAAPAPIGPYNQAILAGNTLYVSGQIPINPENGEVISTSIEAQTHQVMKNLKAILAAAGMNFEHVVKCSIFVKNMADFAKVNDVYGTYFDLMAPARETVEVAELPKSVDVEISCIAVI
ncbi:RidA family protein [Persicobacter psychrovividus]|uniref:Reactive intermediate/imine deaminase n=1 Tax=Persicobacter psychrovividus TaxID=387638 RepID=A0ABN6LBQ3_9BACT|nr:reactive intermediate/imine deaminase [Persicobacter psychrovividus]